MKQVEDPESGNADEWGHPPKCPEVCCVLQSRSLPGLVCVFHASACKFQGNLSLRHKGMTLNITQEATLLQIPCSSKQDDRSRADKKDFSVRTSALEILDTRRVFGVIVSTR